MIVERIKIGPWTATPALNLLERGARSLKIEPRAMDVLVFLARHDGAVVSVEELIASVWKGVIVGDGSVYLAIRQLRQVLDDPVNGTRYIETISKRGYRLTVSAEPVEPAVPVASESAPAHAATQESTLPRIGRPRRWWLGATIVGAVIVAGIVFALRDGTPSVATNTVAVLPFDNLSSDPEQEYFADGVTAEILDVLSRVRDLRVTGQISSFHFKDRSDDLASIGAALGVEHVLEGSVRKAGDHVRVTTQLSNARTGEQLWSESYERRLDDIFAIQDEIAKSVANALQVKLGVGEVGRVPGMTHNVAAYDEYLRGLAILDGQAETFQRGIPHLQRAVALDPSFSIAWGKLSVVYVNGANFEPAKAAEWRRLSDDALERARVLTPDAPHVLLWTGMAETRRGHWREAATLFKQLDESYQRYGLAHRAWGPRGVFLVRVGRVREATPVLERARVEDPLAKESAGLLSLVYTIDGNFQGAFAEVERGLKLEVPDASFLRTAFLIAINQRDRAEIDKRLHVLPDSDPRDRLHHQLARFMDAPAGAAAEIRRLAAVAGQVEMGTLALWAAYYREPDLSLELWTQGMRFPDGLWQPVMRDVRTLPGFKDVVRELGLVDYWRAYGWSDFCHPVGKDDFACS
jgi:TolB-like protein/DNA-binding winged helix-turn-helix (wHTH) protein